MILLLGIGFVAGIIAGVSPCVLPILPIVFVGWSLPVEDTNVSRARRRRAVAVVAGLILSFALLTTFGTIILANLGLPQNFLRDVGIVLLILFGLGLMVPKIEQLLERPFQRLPRMTPAKNTSGFVLGLALGLVFVPCAGPVLATISVLGAKHAVNLDTLLLSLFFSAGAATPLLAVALAGDRLVERNRQLATRSRRWRPYAGALLIAMALAIAFNATGALQRWLPSYTQSLQRVVERNGYAIRELRALSGASSSDGSLLACENVAAQNVEVGLHACGVAPNFTGITAWLNTPGDRALSLSSLRGHVVLVDFWTYSCINCQRTLPHVEAWYHRYHGSGLEVIGVEAPEFAFEHVVSNIRAAAKQLGVVYPIAVDDHLATWTAYSNEYWPAEYLIDASGVVRHVDYGEGNYGATESLIRTLLSSAHPGLRLPPPTNVPNLTPTTATSPETYLGTDRSQYLAGQTMVDGHAMRYQLPTTVPSFEYDLGGTWTPSPQAITAGSNAALTLSFEAKHVYLVLGGKGSVRVSVNGHLERVVSVSGFPTLYDLLDQSSDRAGTLSLRFSPGVAAYDFTFG